jgi:hypothetical protein
MIYKANHTDIAYSLMYAIRCRAAPQGAIVKVRFGRDENGLNIGERKQTIRYLDRVTTASSQMKKARISAGFLFATVSQVA